MKIIKQIKKCLIDYLKRRVTYYKKRHAMAKNAVHDEYLIGKYGIEGTKEMIAKRIHGINHMIEQLEQAIILLSKE